MTLTLTGTAGAPAGVIALGPQTRSLTLTGLADTASGFITRGDLPTVVLYDEDNRWLASAPLAEGIKYQETLSDPGSASLRLPLTAAGSATPGRFVKVFWQGKCRQAAELDDSGVDLAVEGKLFRQWDNLPGVLNLLAKGCVWPEYGLDRTYSSERTFGWMAVRGAWYASGNWTPAVGVHYQADTGFRQFKPASLSYPNPYWIAKHGAYHDEDAGTVQYMRHIFHTFGGDIDYQILATFDDHGELWLDGEQIIAPAPQQSKQWTQLVQVKGTLQAGAHVLAAKVRNGKHRSNPMALILALQQLKKNGDVVTGLPIARTSPYWNVSDVLPGFRRGDVVRRNVFENRAHDIPALSLIRLDFTDENDTTGADWADDPDVYTRAVGEDLLTMVQALAEKDFDIGLDPDTFKLQAWNLRGVDRTGTVLIQRGQASVGSLLTGEVDRRAPKFTVLLFQLADTTWQEYQDDDLVAAYGRIVATVSAGATNTERQAEHTARAMFREQTLADVSFTATLTTLDGPKPYRDFHVGDRISIDDEHGDPIPVRVMSILVDATGDGAPTVELELVRDDADV